MNHTVKILGHWEIGYHAPITERYYWSLPIRDFGGFEWHMCPITGVKQCDQNLNLTEWESYDDFFLQNTDLKRVFIEPRTERFNPNTTWLHSFKHPKDCIYVFGSAHYNPTLKHCRENDVVVSIKTKDDKGVLWADQCLCLVLYDRLIKNGCYHNR